MARRRRLFSSLLCFSCVILVLVVYSKLSYPFVSNNKNVLYQLQDTKPDINVPAQNGDFDLKYSPSLTSRSPSSHHVENSMFNNDSKIPFSNYMRFVNTLHEELSLGPVSEDNKSQLEDLIRSGHGLEPYITTEGESAWIENGIVYRPWRKPDPSTMHKKFPSPYSSEYEAHVPFNEDAFFEGKKPDPRYKTEKKIMLWYTPTRYTKRTAGLRSMDLCPDFPCQITLDRKYQKNSSAMIFAGQILESKPPKRDPGQIFILHNHESPYGNKYFEDIWKRGLNRPEWKKVFNWTMTYRMDSDFVVPYGIVRRRPVPVLNKDYKSIVANKKKVAAWLVSHCKTSSLRETYIKELKKHIQIDIFGSCGDKKCPHMEDGKCADLITKNYKFYLSFENAMCPDYITEKFFHYLTMDTITVTRGSDQYFQHAPREIFLNTNNFPSPKALAERMHYLHNNDDAYIEMLKEKDKYMSLVEGFPVRNQNGYIRFMAYRFDSIGLCNACQRLWNLDKYAKSIPDIHKWFNKKLCAEPKDLKF